MTRFVLGVATAFSALLVALAPGRPFAASTPGESISTQERGTTAPAPPTGRHTTVTASPTAYVINEDFGLGFPPTGWTLTTTNASYPWIQGSDTYGPLDGDALVSEDPLHHAQNEWLKSPTVNLATSISEVVLYFHFKMSYLRGVTDNLQNLEVWISTNGGGTFPTKVWDESMVGVFQNYQWVAVDVNLPTLVGKSSVKIAFRSVGTGGGPVDVDMVQLATFLCGDVNQDQVLTAADVIFLVNYIFKGGAAPVPASDADMNNNGLVNSQDIVYLANHVFKGGAPPPCP